MKRIAIIISKQLDRGQAANVAAILMGQAAVCCPDIYDAAPVADRSGNHHAAIHWSTVLLEANGQGQLLNFAEKVKAEQPALTVVLFSQLGQGLHNAFGEYQAQMSSKTTAELNPVGGVVVGGDAEVRQATKKFSLLK